MTQPDYDIPVSLDTQGVVQGAQQGTSAVEALQVALAGLTVGAVATSRGLDQVSSYGRRGLFGSASINSAIDLQKEMSGLAATSAVTGQSIRGFRGEVEGLARSMPGGTAQVIATVSAVQQLGLSARSQQPQIAALSNEFIQLGAAVGESAPGMATQFGQLNRELASLDPTRLSRFADVLTTLHATSGASASAILSFSQAIAPVAQNAGIGESAILGISTAFTKLGDDGGAAATAVNKILTDLNSSVREGTDTMVAYANATGQTVKQFRALFEANPAQALTQVTQALANAGPQAPYLLQTLGLDPTRTQRALLELSQSGGLGSTINQAVGAYGNGATAKGAAAAFNNVDDKMQQLSTTAGQLGSALGHPVLYPLGIFVELVQGLVGPLAAIATSGVGQVALTAVAGGLLALKGGGLALGGVRRLGDMALLEGGVTSGPVASVLGGRRYASARLAMGAPIGPMTEADAASLEAATLYGPGTFGARHYNPMISRGISGEAMGGSMMAGTNRNLFNLSNRYLGSTGAAGISDADAIIAETAGMSTIGRVGRTALGAGGLGFGGYLHMARAPFALAQQNAVDRNFRFTQEGGPGRGLVDSLGDGGVRDAAVRNAALKTFGTELGDTTAVMPRFRNSILSYLTAVGGYGLQTGATAGRIGGGLAMRGLGWAASNPIIAGLGVGVTAYELYQHSKNNAQNDTTADDPSQMFSVVNQYRDSLGEAGVAAVNMAQQFNAAASAISRQTTTFKQAKTVTSQDIQAWGAPTGKAVHTYTGSSSSIATQIAATYAGTTMTPQDLQAVKRDLYNQAFSPGQIGQIMAQVPTSNAAQAINSGQINSLLGHALSDTGGHTGSLWSSFKHQLANNASQLLNPGSSTSTAEWRTIGRTGAGSPDIGTVGKAALATLAQGINQTASANFTSGGAKYSMGQELSQVNQAEADAMKTKNANLVVATEQALTRMLTGKAIGGLSASDIQQAGSLTNLMATMGAKVGDEPISQMLSSLGAKALHTTPIDVTALHGNARTLFGTLYSGATGGLAGRVNAASTTGVGDPGQVSRTAIAVVAALAGSGTTLNAIAAAATRSLNTTSGGQQVVQQAVLAQAQLMQATAQIGMTQGQSLGAQAQQASTLLNMNGPSTQQQFQQGQQMAQQVLQSTTSYYQQRIMAQYNFQIQSERAEADYTLQISRNEQDFQVQSLRNWQDYSRQLARNIQDAESQYYNPFQRIAVVPTFSASELAQNLETQNQALTQQETNLNRARAMGLSAASVNVLGLQQTTNAQQLQQLVQQFASDPNVIKTINAEIAKRGGATGALYKDTGDVTYQRQKQDYDIQVSRLQADFALQESRAQQDFSIQMTRMSQDLHDQDLEITGNMNTLHKDMIAILHGQTVDWSHSLVNTMKQTVKDVTPFIHTLKDKLNGAASRTAGVGQPPEIATTPGSTTSAEGPTGLGGAKVAGGMIDGRFYTKTSAQNRAFIYAELGTESGDYNAQNKQSGALGAYQILPSNIPSWSKEILGHSITAQQFLNSPRLQDIIAQGMLLKDVAKYGYRGAASTWYSGSPGNADSTALQPGGYPSVKTYVDDVIAKMLAAPQSLLNPPAHHKHHKHHHKATSPHGTSSYVTNDQARQITSGGMAHSVAVDARSYHYDSRTQILGEVKVVASSPTELGDQLAKKQRTDNLTATKGGPPK